MTTGTSARHVREIDRIPDGATMPAYPIDLKPLLGTWRNANHRTWGVAALTLSRRDGRVWAHAWAADSPAGESHDWGEAALDGLYTDGPLSARVCGFRVTFDLGHAHTQLQTNLLHSVMVCAAFTSFSDDSGRRNYMSREFLHRRR